MCIRDSFTYCKEPEVNLLEEGKPVFNPADFYEYKLDPADKVPTIVVEGAGAGKLIFVELENLR